MLHAGNTLKLGIAGDKYIKPYGIVILFMSQVRCCCNMLRLWFSDHPQCFFGGLFDGLNAGQARQAYFC